MGGKLTSDMNGATDVFDVKRAITAFVLAAAVIGLTAGVATIPGSATPTLAYPGEGDGPCRGRVPGPCPW
jgi:hypothetical protein